LQENLTNGQERRYNSIHQQRNLLNVLRRSIEIATQSGRSPYLLGGTTCVSNISKES